MYKMRTISPCLAAQTHVHRIEKVIVHKEIGILLTDYNVTKKGIERDPTNRYKYEITAPDLDYVGSKFLDQIGTPAQLHTEVFRDAICIGPGVDVVGDFGTVISEKDHRSVPGLNFYRYFMPNGFLLTCVHSIDPVFPVNRSVLLDCNLQYYNLTNIDTVCAHFPCLGNVNHVHKLKNFAPVGHFRNNTVFRRYQSDVEVKKNKVAQFFKNKLLKLLCKINNINNSIIRKLNK
jgi:hypothetical protein